MWDLNISQLCGGYRLLWFWGSASILCEAWGLALCCYWSAIGCHERATCSWSRLTALLLRRLLGVLALHWGSLDGACCLEKPDEARELIWLVLTKVFANLLLSLVTLRLTEHVERTREVHCWNCACYLVRVILVTDWLNWFASSR
jgi:hypothetical protein